MKHPFLIVLVFITCSFIRPERLVAQTAVPVTIAIRTADGAPAVGEEVRLIHQPSLTLETTVTDENGQTVFNVPRGLYEVAFTRQLDSVSALAVAEGGLHNFGLTVGDEAIIYHFTFQPDGRVYFDSAPVAAIPVPIVPQLADLHLMGGVGQPTHLPATIEPNNSLVWLTPTPVITATPIPIKEIPAQVDEIELICGYLGGLALGVAALFMVGKPWLRKRN